MSFIHIEEPDSQSLLRVNRILAGIPGGVWNATYSAIKRAGDAAKTNAGRFAAAEYSIKKSDFMDNVNMKTEIRGGQTDGVISLGVRYSGTVLPLLTFNTKFSRKGLVQTKVKRDGSATVLQHVFISNMAGPIAPFEREETSRLPVQQKYGPSTAHMMQNETVIEKMDQTVQTVYKVRIEHEITRVLNGWGGKNN